MMFLRINVVSPVRISGQLASRNTLFRDTRRRVSIPGHPGKSGTGGNPIWLAQLVKSMAAPTHVRSCVQEVRV